MSTIIKDIREIPVENSQIAIQWLGQAGFLMKTCDDLVIAVDPYLTDSVEHELGPDFKRLMAPVFTPEEFSPDLLLVTHHHGDHYDTEAVPAIMKNTRIRMVCCPATLKTAAEDGIDISRIYPLKDGEELIIEGITIKGVFADHGSLAPEAIGFLLTLSGITIYIAGDTAYVPDRIQKSLGINPDIMIAPINGEFGNLNGTEAAQLAADLNAEMVIPCHFWTFAIHKGDPLEFIQAMHDYAPRAQSELLCQGELTIYRKDTR